MTTVPLGSYIRKSLPENFYIMHSLLPFVLPIVKILKKKLESTEKFGRKGGLISFNGSSRKKRQFW